MASLVRPCRLLSRNFVHFRLINPALSQTSRLYADHIVNNRGATEPPIPEWKEPKNETLDLKKARLLYQSRKRGMLENGLLLSSFAAQYLHSFNDAQLKLYDHLINKPSNDWDIYYWAVGNKPTPEEYNTEVMDLLKKFAKNEKMDKAARS
ncbi:succinate dehydrogenase assembly factor 2, mitochondrial-like [Ptychodera flava]|uniref:succinate dehydrogenase assembly factor 2, mitochondrial-like n=1 Tax=Ptychodera flava TaxID=63121 RepID=UPI00396A25B9